MSDAGIAVVVVAYDSEETLDECLSRLRAAQDVEEIRVVDNASRDASIDLVQRHALADPRLRFIANPDNPGFAVACNQGAAASTAPWLAFVNPDCFIEADTLARLRGAALTLGDALVGGVLRGEDGALDAAARRRDPDFAAMLRSRGARELSIQRDPARPLQQVDAISGALMLLPRALFARIGGFDEGYRLHAEDLDLCRRARQSGGVVAIANEVEVLHVRGVSSRARPLFVEWHKHRGLWRYFRRFEATRRGRLTRAAVFAMIWGRFPLAALRAALRR
ncbi:glycosyltransferase family 2 protein [Thermomonas sp. XSG]|uniref:glycosyltransferase family 2 protein n=1 Tax=Thermomonas sp. XSG TaxID=2771436 RepID=UPI00086F8E56|nr:glycosyltransferase family 2 protein [Thermomonas sp. XSG]ODU48808.1 MAG: glycosyl transferase [Xanthomonadaceae bacterium SCN 69-48]QNU14804.1 glycosyltransferase family 2 protein [Thermomonas sp. XSG]